MWKLIVLGVAVYLLYRLFANDFFKKRQAEAKVEREERDAKIATGEMVKDPECGAFVAIDDSISVRDGERVFYFCSYECRDKFLQRLQSGDTNLPNGEG